MSPTSPAPSSPAPRLLLYSHDSYGLGHFRRCMTLAEELTRSLPDAAVLVATGSPCSSHFALPPRVEVVKLPSVTKDERGRYVSRGLPFTLAAVLDLRRHLLREIFRAFRPHLLIADHQVTGLRDELLDTLREARAAGTRTVLGLRDVIDVPSAVARDWDRPEARHALRELYDRICVYGAPTVLDHRIEYALPPEAADRLEFVGYVVRPPPRHRILPLPPERPQVLITVGGGQDGAGRLELYLDALAGRPPSFDSRLLLGPLLPRPVARRLRRRARLIPGVTVHEFHADVPRLLAETDAVIAMAGYNTVAEILQSGLPAVLLPRRRPRREQLVRARRLARLGLLESLERPTAETLRDAIERALLRRRRPPPALPLDGARCLSSVVVELLGAAPSVPVRSLSA